MTIPEAKSPSEKITIMIIKVAIIHGQSMGVYNMILYLQKKNLTRKVQVC
jgi:hypothetical protein